MVAARIASHLVSGMAGGVVVWFAITTHTTLPPKDASPIDLSDVKDATTAEARGALIIDRLRKLKAASVIGDISCTSKPTLAVMPAFFSAEFKYKLAIARTAFASCVSSENRTTTLTLIDALTNRPVGSYDWMGLQLDQ